MGLNISNRKVIKTTNSVQCVTKRPSKRVKGKTIKNEILYIRNNQIKEIN
jgi:hypothetical protein